MTILSRHKGGLSTWSDSDGVKQSLGAQTDFWTWLSPTREKCWLLSLPDAVRRAIYMVLHSAHVATSASVHKVPLGPGDQLCSFIAPSCHSSSAGCRWATMGRWWRTHGFCSLSWFPLSKNVLSSPFISVVLFFTLIFRGTVLQQTARWILTLVFLLCFFSDCRIFHRGGKSHSHRSMNILFYAYYSALALVFWNSKDTGSWNSKSPFLKSVVLGLSFKGLFWTSKAKHWLFLSLDPYWKTSTLRTVDTECRLLKGP